MKFSLITFLILISSVLFHSSNGAQGQATQDDSLKYCLRLISSNEMSSEVEECLWQLITRLDPENAERYCWYLGGFRGASCVFDYEMIPLLREDEMKEAYDLAERLYLIFAEADHRGIEDEYGQVEGDWLHDYQNYCETILLTLHRHPERLQEAIYAIRKILVIDGKPVPARHLFLLGACLLRDGDYAEALSVFERAIKKQDGQRSVLLLASYGKAQCQRLMGDFEVAAEEFVRILTRFDVDLKADYVHFSLEEDASEAVPYPDRTLCDEVLLHAAECYLALGMEEAGRMMFTCVRRFCPRADGVEEAERQLELATQASPGE